MWHADLEQVGISYRDEERRFRDLHSLRASNITRLTRSGIPAEAKALALHSTITLAMDTYTHLGVNDTRTALDRRSSHQHLCDEPERLQATGTIDSTPAIN